MLCFVPILEVIKVISYVSVYWICPPLHGTHISI